MQVTQTMNVRDQLYNLPIFNPPKKSIQEKGFAEVLKLEIKVQAAASSAGITRQQAYKFIEAFGHKH